MKTALVLGAGGFIGSHMVKRLRNEGYWVRGVDLKYPEFSSTEAHDFVIADLRDNKKCESVIRLQVADWAGKRLPLPYSYLPKEFTSIVQFDEVYQFACDMGGAGYVFTGENDANIMRSAIINFNVCQYLTTSKVFYSSSACIYPQWMQSGNDNYSLKESDAWPADPDSCYGIEKLFSERLYQAYARNNGLNIRIARFHNIYGPEGTYKGGKEKAPAAICRKVIEATDHIDIWGDGEQTRSFLYIDDCIDAVRLLMRSDFKEPVNIGSEEMVSINDLAQVAIGFSGKDIAIKNIPGPTGVRGRNSDNTLIRQVLNWEPKYSLKEGLQKTYNWLTLQYANKKGT